VQLFAGAGVIMPPVVLTGALARWKLKWFKWLRVILASVSIGVTAVIAYSEIIDKFGWSLATIGRISLMVAIYTIIVRALKATVAGKT